MVNAIKAPLAELDQALESILSEIQSSLASEWVDVLDADGRVLCADVRSEINVPAFDNSSMDGWAVRSQDLHEPGDALRISQRITAGDGLNRTLEPGEAARIFTGAPIPIGADAVIMQEVAKPLGEQRVSIETLPRPGQWIRRAGEDIQKNQVVLAKGHRLSPADLGLLASLGLSKVQVSRKPRVALFSTGNELVQPGSIAPSELPLGRIFNSNRYFLAALLTRAGATVTDLGLIPDRLDETCQAFGDARLSHDVILSSGGVSVGEEDHVKPAVEALGRLKLWALSMKPGKPFAYGQMPTSVAEATTCHFMGLPGNPVSSFVTFLLLVRPFLLRLQGATQLESSFLSMRADFDWPKPDRRREFIRVRMNDQGGLEVFPNQSSGVLTSVSWAQGLVDVPSGQVIAKGDMVRFLPWSFI